MATNTLKTLGAVALLSLMPVVALAAQPTGKWQGYIMQANADVHASISFTPDGANVHFDEPFVCDVPAKFFKEDGGSVIYRFSMSRNGGRFCDSVMSRDLTIAMAADGGMRISFDTPKANWRGEFRQMSAP